MTIAGRGVYELEEIIALDMVRAGYAVLLEGETRESKKAEKRETATAGHFTPPRPAKK